MKPIDAIEFILRGMERPLSTEELYSKVEGVVNEQPFTMSGMLSIVRAHDDLFEVMDDGHIRLQLSRLNNGSQYFKERLIELRRALRLMPSTNAQWLEVAIIYALATRMSGMEPTLISKERGLWITLGPLAEENPELKRQISLSLDSGGIMVMAPVEFAVRQLATVRLSPWGYVQQMRWLVSNNARSGQYVVPTTTAELMVSLLGSGVQEVFDPAADASVVPVVLAHAPPGSIGATAVFTDPFTRFFNDLQARILGVELRMLKWEDLGPGREDGKRYAHCISAPPLGGRIREEGALRTIEPYELAINQIIKRLAARGRAVVLVPESMLFSNARAVWRRSLLEQGILRSIISLPGGSLYPYAAVKTSILVLDRTQGQGTPVQFVDATQYVATNPREEPQIDIAALLDLIRFAGGSSAVRLVSIDEIRGHEYNLNAARYLFRPEEVIEGGVRLGDRVVPLKLDRFDSGSKAPFARIRDLKEGAMEYQLHLDQLEVHEVPRHAKKLDCSALLVALRWGNLKPTWFEYSGTPIAVTSDILVLDVDRVVIDIPFLVHQLLSSKVQAQVEWLRMGEVIPSLRKSDILDLRIELPPKPEQQAKVKGLREAHVEALRKKAEQEAERHGIQLQQVGNTVSFKHRLGTPLLSVGSGIDTMRMSLDRIQPAWRDLVVSAREQITLGAIMDNVTYELQRISAMLDADSLELEVDKYPLEPMDLAAYAKKATRRAQADLNGGHEVSFFMSADIKDQLKGKAPIMGNRALLDTAMDALVDNARRHGFAEEQGPHRLDIRVGLRVDDNKTWLVLAVGNSGKPFPEGFGKDRYIRKNVHAGPTGHTGIGGYHVNEIVIHHKGYLELITRPKLMGPLSSEIELYFPLAH